MRNILAKDAYDAGAKATRKGNFRVSPYYENPRADYWWLAGFDGIDFFKAGEQQPNFPSRIVSGDTARSMGLPVPAEVAEVHFESQ